MPDTSAKPPKSPAEARRERQAAALRDNLRKRKQQARELRQAEPGHEPGPRDDGKDR